MDLGTNNFLVANRFRFEIARAPHVNFNLVEVEIPGVTAPAVNINTPRLAIPKHADHAIFSDFTVTFKITEDMSNYIELFSWMTKSAAIKSTEQHAELKYAPVGSLQTVYSDLTLTIISSSQNPVAQVTFTDAFPTALTPINFSTAESGELNCTATFSYVLFDIQAIS